MTGLEIKTKFFCKYVLFIPFFTSNNHTTNNKLYFFQKFNLLLH